MEVLWAQRSSSAFATPALSKQFFVIKPGIGPTVELQSICSETCPRSAYVALDFIKFASLLTAQPRGMNSTVSLYHRRTALICRAVIRELRTHHRRISALFSDTVKPSFWQPTIITAIFLASSSGHLKATPASSAHSVPHTVRRTSSSRVSSVKLPSSRFAHDLGVKRLRRWAGLVRSAVRLHRPMPR